MFESAKITKSSARKSEATLSSEMDLDGEQTRAILFLAWNKVIWSHT